MNTITRIVANTWVTGRALNNALVDVEYRETPTVVVEGFAPRFLYDTHGYPLFYQLSGPIVIEVEGR